MRNYTILFIILSYCGQLLATSFVPLSIKDQIKDSDGVIHGKVESLEPVSGENGRIFTKVSIRPEKWLALERPENSLFEVYYPGGVIDGVAQLTHGSPKFELGEEVVLLVRKKSGSMWVNNLAMGKYDIKRVGDKRALINNVFPGRPNIGQMEMDSFFILAQEIKGQKVSYKFKTKAEVLAQQVENNTRRGRKIASINNEASQFSEGSDSSQGMLWPVLLLGFIFIGVSFIRRRFS